MSERCGGTRNLAPGHNYLPCPGCPDCAEPEEPRAERWTLLLPRAGVDAQPMVVPYREDGYPEDAYPPGNWRQVGVEPLAEPRAEGERRQVTFKVGPIDLSPEPEEGQDGG